MSDLDTLERDVIQARARFANDLARLRSPDNLARFKDDLWTEARETTDDLVGKTKEAAKEAAKDGAQRVLTELKERAAANALATAAIGCRPRSRRPLAPPRAVARPRTPNGSVPARSRAWS